MAAARRPPSSSTPFGAASTRPRCSGAILVVGVVAMLFALVSPSDYVTRVAFTVALYTLLATGLNVVVGWSGLLDLGYAAFFGFGAYAYACSSSDKFHLHWPTPRRRFRSSWPAPPSWACWCLPSRRLSGDYLAIVTLFFGQIFVSIANNGDHCRSPQRQRDPGTFNLTGGPNGVTGIDPMGLRRPASPAPVTTTRRWSWSCSCSSRSTACATPARAWHCGRCAKTRWPPRSSRSPFAGSGSLPSPSALRWQAGRHDLRRVQQSVFGSNFDVPFLSSLYASAILGGLGNLGAGFVGAFIVAVLPEMLRTPSTGRLLVYGALVAFPRAAHAATRSSRSVRRLADRQRRRGPRHPGRLRYRSAPRGSGLSGFTGALVPHLERSVTFGNVAFLALIAGGLALTLLSRGGARSRAAW